MRQRYRTEIIVPLPEVKARGDSHGFMMKEWEKRWRSSDTCKHTKIFWERPDEKRSKQMLRLSRYEHGVVSRYFMGFNYTAYFKSKINKNISPYCASCLEVGLYLKETGEHVILHCDRWSERRRRILEIEGENPGKIDPIRLARFLSKKEIKELEKGV